MTMFASLPQLCGETMHCNCAPLALYKIAKPQGLILINNAYSTPSCSLTRPSIATMSSTISSPSTSSLQSTTSSASSTMPLRFSAPQKDYSAAFSALQSTYGMGVGQLSSSMPVPKTKPSKPFQLRSLFRHSAKASPLSAPESYSTENVTSPPSRSPKDYEAAFGAL